MFGRRRGARDRDPESVTAPVPGAAEEGFDADDEDFAVGGEPRAAGGPWDAAEPYPDVARIDFGSLRIPAFDDMQIQLIFAEQQGACIIVHHGQSELQLMAFAAPKRNSLWDDIRGEIQAEVTSGGGVASERVGPFGTELLTRLAVTPGQPRSGLQPTLRFTGVDGPRWFLRGLFSGAAAEDAAAAAPLEALMSEVVVVRGDHPVPPRDLLEIRLPAEAAQALAEEQARAQQENPEENRFATPPNPFERGPEITETR